VLVTVRAGYIVSPTCVYFLIAGGTHISVLNLTNSESQSAARAYELC